MAISGRSQPIQGTLLVPLSGAIAAGAATLAGTGSLSTGITQRPGAIVSFDNFEGGLNGWSAFPAGPTLVQSSAWSHDGAFSALLTPDGVPASPIMVKVLAASPGQVLAISAWLNSPQGYSQVEFGVDFFDSGNNYLTGYYPAPFNLPAATPGNYTTGPFPLPAGVAT